MRRHSWFAISAAMLSLCGCASTGYHTADEGHYGYSDRQLTADTYEVSFAGNEHTSTEQVHDFALRHAAELAVRLGFTCLAVLDEKSSPIAAVEPEAAVPDASSIGTGGSYGYPSSYSYGASAGHTESSPAFRDVSRGNFTTLRVRYFNDANDARGQHVLFAEVVLNVLENKYMPAGGGY
jgi:hypothetical protein